MDVNRRDVLKALMGGSAVAAVATTGLPLTTAAKEDSFEVLPDALGLMYDATKCIGCRACMPACQNANGLKADVGGSGGLYMQPDSLNAHTKNLITLYVAADGHERSFMKKQCMHCVDPACVSACPMEALHKEPDAVYRMPVLPGSLSVQHSQIRMGQSQPEDREVRAVPAHRGNHGNTTGVHQGLPDACGDLREADGFAGRSETENQGKAGLLR